MSGTLTKVLNESPEGQHYFLSFRKKNDAFEWKYKKLGIYKRLLRKIFGFYKATHQRQVATALKQELNLSLLFEKDTASVKKIVLVAQQTLSLKSPNNSSDDRTFRNYVEHNQNVFQSILSTGVSCKIRKNDQNRFGILITDKKIYCLTGNRLGNSFPRGNHKKIQHVYDYQADKNFARIVLDASKPKNKKYVEREFKNLKKVKGMEGCIQIISGFKRDKKKIDMILEKADGDLQGLMEKRKFALSEDQINSIFRQFLEILTKLEEKKIWHMDIKLANLLYFEKDGVFKIALADYEFATTSRWVGERNGTLKYMAPELKNKFFKTIFQNIFRKNGRRGDVYSMGVVLKKLFSGQQHKNKEPIAALIKDMKNSDPSKRPTARQALDRFNALNT